MRIGLFYQIQVPKPQHREAGSRHWHIMAGRRP